MSVVQYRMIIHTYCLEPDGILQALTIKQVAKLARANLFSCDTLDVETGVQVGMNDVVIFGIAVAQSERLVYTTIISIIVTLDAGT